MELEVVLRFILSVSLAGAGGITRLFINGNEMIFTWKTLLIRAWIACFIGTITYFILQEYNVSVVWVIAFVGLSGFLAVESGEPKTISGKQELYESLINLYI